MELSSHFDAFLRNTVNLNATRITQLEVSTNALETFLEGSSYAATIEKFEPQGSWAHETIIRPVDAGEFDADLLMYVTPVEGWDATDYLSKLRKVFADSPVYKEMVTRSSHCVTIHYANEKKVDIAPVLVRESGSPEVCNWDSNAFEATEPRKYTDWLIGQNQHTGTNQLRKVTRLLKYLRDIKTRFTCPSVLLTTILGQCVYATDANNTADFTSVSRSFKTLIGRLDTWLQANPTRPRVGNQS